MFIFITEQLSHFYFLCPCDSVSKPNLGLVIKQLSKLTWSKPPVFLEVVTLEISSSVDLVTPVVNEHILTL